MITKIQKNSDVLTFLKSYEFEHLNVLNYLEYAPHAEIFTLNSDVKRGIVVRMVDDGSESEEYEEEGFFVASQDAEFLLAFWDSLSAGEKFFSGVPEKATEIFYSISEALWKSPCFVFVYDESCKKDIASKAYNSVYADDFLRINDVEIVDNHYTYQHEGSDDAIREAILTLDSSCVRIDGELAAWCLVHAEDGTLGPLYTMEAHRRKGLAEIVTARLVGKLVSSGKMPFMHIVKDNVASLKMIEKLPFKHSHNVAFFGMKKS